MPILPDERRERSTFAIALRLPTSLAKELDAVSDAAEMTRSEMIEHILKWGVQEVRKEIAQKKGKK